MRFMPSPQALRVLKYLAQQSSASLTSLRRQCVDMGINVDNACAALQRAGLVEYRPHGDNPKEQQLALTARGHFLLQRISPKAAFLYRQVEKRQNHPTMRAVKEQFTGRLTTKIGHTVSAALKKEK